MCAVMNNVLACIVLIFNQLCCFFFLLPWFNVFDEFPPANASLLIIVYETIKVFET